MLSTYFIINPLLTDSFKKYPINDDLIKKAMCDTNLLFTEIISRALSGILA